MTFTTGVAHCKERGRSYCPSLLTRVMLQKFVHSDVPHLDTGVGAGSGNTRSTWVKPDVINEATMFVERVYALLRLCIPQLHRLVVAT